MSDDDFNFAAPSFALLDGSLVEIVSRTDDPDDPWLTVLGPNGLFNCRPGDVDELGGSDAAMAALEKLLD